MKNCSLCDNFFDEDNLVAVKNKKTKEEKLICDDCFIDCYQGKEKEVKEKYEFKHLLEL